MKKNVLITGGSRGIGAAAVLAFARAGYQVAFTWNNHASAAEQVLAQAQQMAPNSRFLALRADAADAAQVATAVRRAEQELGGLQVLVCNAGIAQQNCSPTPPTRIGGGLWGSIWTAPFTHAALCCPA